MISDINNIKSELERISLSLDFITSEDGKKILHIVNQRLYEILRARIIDVRWKEVATDGVIFQPFFSTEPDPKPYPLNETSGGVWSWLYKEARPVWVENDPKRGSGQPLKNLAIGVDIEDKYLKIDPKTRHLISVPLLLKDVVWGAYTFEWGEFGKVDAETLDSIRQLGPLIARIVWKVDVYNRNKKHTGQSIALLEKSIFSPSFITVVLNPYRAGFIARPFEPAFNDIEKFVKSFINKHRIKAQHYVSTHGRPIVIEDLQREIRSSHFGIVDITGLNENVMIELGMLMVLERKVLLLRRFDDQSDKSDEMKLPFDLQGRQIYRYQIAPPSAGKGASTPEINVINAADGQAVKLSEVLYNFIAELQSDRSFEEALPWEDETA